MRGASRTALLIAAYRARATARPHPICHDPWAAALAGPEGFELAARLDAVLPHMELWVAVRTAVLDAHVALWTTPKGLAAAHVARSIDQVVLLGAGLDARAGRLARPGLRFFEVDHPASQEEKRRRLGELTGYPAAAATHVPCDFERDDFLDRLHGAGLSPERPALLLWEGVTPYLQEPAIRTTLRRIAEGCHEDSILLFDHFNRSMAEGKGSHRDDETRAFVDDLGEPVVFGTNDPLPMLYDEGFRHVRSLSFDEACLSLTGTYDRSREFRFQRIVLCSRTPTHLP